MNRRPEIVPLGVTVAAWSALVVLAGTAPSPAHHAAGMAVPGVMTVAMVVAMTAPFALPGVRSVVFASLWWLARRAAICYTAAFLAAWLAIATGLALLVTALTWAIPADSAACMLLVAAGVAQADPDRRRKLADCGRPARIRVRPRDALRDWCRGAFADAGRCARLCALPMLAMLALPAGLLTMAALAGLGVAERVVGGRHRVAVGAGYLALALALIIT
jgi:hypothetical protein